MVGRTLFYGQTDGMLYKRSFDGVSFGDPVAVNPYLDPLWNTVDDRQRPGRPDLRRRAADVVHAS